MLTREQFRVEVFVRDKGRCVLCGAVATAAHHIMERRLFADGGYILDNGASVCDACHWQCENTTISVEKILTAAGISRRVTPAHLYKDQPYDKWGDPILPNGMRLRGELFQDGSVQKALAPVLHLFTHWVKYPRTYHLPWSEDVHADDRVLNSVELFEGRRVIVTEKLDGENTTMYQDHIHARSLDSDSNMTRHWVKGFWGRISIDIPREWRVCGENLFATHAIHYADLPGYFMGFSVWDDANVCQSWETTVEWFKLLDIPVVPVLYDGIFDAAVIKQLYQHGSEGYVVRLADRFPYARFRYSVAKFVREGHIKTTKHWLRGKPIVPNELRPR